MSEPLKIVFKVAGGWVPPPYPLHLDAILAYAETMLELEGMEEGDPNRERLLREFSMSLPLPFDRHEQEGEWVWKASAIRPVGEVMNSTRFFTQRRDCEDYAINVHQGNVRHGRHKHGAPMTHQQYQIDTLRGPFRNLLGFYSTQQAFDGATIDLVAWCVGDRHWLESRLTDGLVTHLGARRRSGHGRIVSVEITEDDAALTAWQMRVLPWRTSEADTPLQAAWRAPYWAAENRGQAYLPAGF